MLFITPVQQSSLTKQEEGGNLILQNKLGGNKIAKNSVTTANRKMKGEEDELVVVDATPMIQKNLKSVAEPNDGGFRISNSSRRGFMWAPQQIHASLAKPVL